MQLVDANDPILRTPTLSYVFPKNTSETEEYIAAMMAVMEAENGIALAANQVGLPWSMFVLNGDPYAVFNPRIVDTSEEMVLLEEGCLTYPKLFVKVKRPKSIRIRFQDYRGEIHTEKYSGMTARIIQHEMDHLAGKIFYNSASAYHRDTALRKWRSNK